MPQTGSPSSVGCNSSVSASVGTKRKPDEDGSQINSRVKINEPRGEKRGPDEIPPGDGDMGAWLAELCRIPEEIYDTIMVLDIDGAAVGDDLVEIFSPPRVVLTAKKHGLKADISIDKCIEKSPGIKWDLDKKSHQNEVLKMVEKPSQDY